MRVVTKTRIDQLQEKADNLERLYEDLNAALTPDSSLSDHAVIELVFQKFEETYTEIYALIKKEHQRRKFDPRTWFSKK